MRTCAAYHGMVCVHVTAFELPSQELWVPPLGTLAKDVQNVRLALAYEDFVSWAKQRKIEPLQLHLKSV